MITHAGVIRACLDLCENIPIQESLKIDIPYNSLEKIEFKLSQLI